jgi:hypothetical protein
MGVVNLKDKVILTRCDNFLLLYDQGLKLFYLSDLSISILIVTLSYTSQLTHTAA